MTKKIFLILGVALLAAVLVVAQTQGGQHNGNQNGNGQNHGNGQGQGQGQGQGNGQGQGQGQGGQNAKGPGYGFNGGMTSLLESLPFEAVDAQEEQGLRLMREEEKLARDVYTALFETWKEPIFQNISRSEQRHMDAIKTILNKYSLQDPVTVDTPGIFSDQNLQNLYFQLVQSGSVSLIEAMKVGALIEDLDIYDLKNALGQTDNQDIKILYQNLMKGSRNHLRSFGYQLNRLGATYAAQHLTQADVDGILNTPMERGLLDENGEQLYGSSGW
ncbi:DUF2202 domain-containing protein [Acidobacteriota bacterium]